jgi:hypothetical protein
MIARTQTTVQGLLAAGCLSAIGGRIAAIVVDAIKAQVFWFFTHVREKVSKFLPALANRNATAAVVSIVFVGFVMASFVHTKPNVEGITSLPICRVAMPEIGATGSFALETSARLCLAGSQAVASNIQFGAAIATNSPTDKSPFVGRAAEDGQSSITMACDIKEVGHCSLHERLPCQVAAGSFGGARSPRLKV